MNGVGWLRIAAVLGAAGVFIGAFGAHWLEKFPGVSSFSSEQLTKSREWLETGVRYHFYHTLALFGVGVLATLKPDVNLASPAIAFLVGILIFSGALYVMTVSQIRVLGAIVPIGGVAFIVGWVLLAIKVGNLKL